MNTFSVKLGDLLAKPHKPDIPKPHKSEVPKLENKEDKAVLKTVKSHPKETKKSREVSMSSPKGNVNIQDQFLNHMRREKAPVTVHLLDGKEIHGHIKSFDNFCIQLESSGNTETLVYKHGISSLTPSKVSDYTKKD